MSGSWRGNRGRGRGRASPVAATPGTTESGQSLDGVFRALGDMATILGQHIRRDNRGAAQVVQDGIGGLIEKFKRLKPPTFEGLSDPMEAEKWKKQIEKIFTVLGCDEEQKEQKAEEFISLEQGEMTVGQYESKFTELSRFAPFMIQDEARKAKKFERGLRGSIRNKLTPLKLRLYADVVERALMIERDNEEFWKSRNQKREAKSNARAASNTSQTQGDASKKLKTMVTNTSTPAQPMNRFTGKCYNCGMEGHSARFCKQPPQQPHYQAPPQMHPRPQP
ncbi:uncharacterized protein LOC131251850 [Magnolia sinica]|uniref:uncharacterized protein LOC131251850 n=1 Tax=Magnolia sinica TaxID=86752 RepID=UPI00265A7958|nr:uncharacterized protein LOC131251850 [Magnolia sinica]